jgi:hypothetical protein
MSQAKLARRNPGLALALVVAAGCNAAFADDRPSHRDRDRDRRFSVDVVADCNRFTSEGIGHPSANPKFGDYFMQEGLIYKAGTLAKHCPNGDGCGLNPDGSPQFPEAVIGKWTCFGSFVGKGAGTAQGTWVYTTQVYEFNAQQIEPNVFAPGKHAIISQGPERNDLKTPWQRAVNGGYGKFQGALGEVVQTKIGFNPTTCENFTFDFTFEVGRR